MNSTNHRLKIFQKKDSRKFQKAHLECAACWHLFPSICIALGVISHLEMNSEGRGGCASIICNYCTIFYRGLEHPRILVGGAGFWNPSLEDTEGGLYLECSSGGSVRKLTPNVVPCLPQALSLFPELAPEHAVPSSSLVLLGLILQSSLCWLPSAPQAAPACPLAPKCQLQFSFSVPFAFSGCGVSTDGFLGSDDNGDNRKTQIFICVFIEPLLCWAKCLPGFRSLFLPSTQ